MTPVRWQNFVDNANKRAKKHGVSGRLSWTMTPPEGPCAYCGGASGSWDHVVALRSGGGNYLDNIVPACTPCNRRKSTRPVAEFVSIGTELHLLCGWCWTPIVRSWRAVRQAESRGRRYFVCSRACGARLSAVQAHPVMDDPSPHTAYMRDWRNRRRKMVAGL